MIFREATPADASAVQGLYRELVSDPLIGVLPEQVATLAASPASYLLVAESDHVVCATVLVTLCPDAMYRTQPFGVLENFIVTEAMRGRGVGRLLMRRVEELAVIHHCSKLMLLSGSSRAGAHAFFQRSGFAGDTKLGFVKYRRHFAASS